ncbi:MULTISPECIES: DUF1788 domain-containing protein [Lactobacillus]|jgi:hypothetical protein|uniref:DUF1788 domain-containing protein n=1 Tax=Lactobacillus TaxID=1578 RepID=UPI0008A24303|nr:MULTISPECIES: DUF1788 domain-containing protein [Lactobacillus]MCD5531401.1 DUF1788 domain-containing protein [Lactobacillus delbrueckii subsp. lactis]MCD5598667.1 DUF1788 domain-containing protein [Lactobacillus delbrueckii subsp. lactis]MCS8615771.1 DUF1788 domain-containing protein [Lactobacillus delbrueckii subsp. lactis]OFS72426.1 cytoplasmic protein [Lactobacillus sp. HMSC08B12]
MTDSLNARLDSFKKTIQTSDFLEGKGLSNEVNIRIFCYDPKDEMKVRYYVEQLQKDTSLKCNLITRNLYDVFLDICQNKRLLDKIPAKEEKKGSEKLLVSLKGARKVQNFVEQIQYEPQETGDILLLTGVGEVYPFLRLHTLLEALQPVIPKIPIVVMYPGSFDGHQLTLFNKLQPNDYYRAFNLI